MVSYLFSILEAIQLVQEARRFLDHPLHVLGGARRMINRPPWLTNNTGRQEKAGVRRLGLSVTHKKMCKLALYFQDFCLHQHHELPDSRRIARFTGGRHPTYQRCSWARKSIAKFPGHL